MPGRDAAPPPGLGQVRTAECFGGGDGRRDQQRLGDGGVANLVRPGSGADRDQVASGQV